MKRLLPGCALLLVLTGLVSSARISYADDSNEPYIDALKKTLKPESSQGYTEKLKKELPSEQGSEGYSEELKKELKLKEHPSQGYSAKLKKELPPKKRGGAIEAFREGKKLHAIKKGTPRFSFSLRMGLGVTRNFTAEPGLGTGRSFSSVYGSGLAPDLGLQFEYEFIRTPIATFSVFGVGQVAWFSGNGTFAAQITSAYDGSVISPDATHVTFRFFEVPGVAGLKYRLDLFHYVRPFAMVGPMLVGYSEDRSDGGTTSKGLSHGVWGAAGISVLMDWWSKSNSWDRYMDYGILHTYIDLQYVKVETFSSPVDFSSSGFYLGFTFEY